MHMSAPPSLFSDDPVRPRFRSGAQTPRVGHNTSPILAPQHMRVPPSYTRSGPNMKLNGALTDTLVAVASANPMHLFPSAPNAVKDMVGVKTPPPKDPNVNSTPFTPDAITSNFMSPSGGGQATQTGQPFTIPDNVSYAVAPQIPPWMIYGGLGLAVLLFMLETRKS